MGGGSWQDTSAGRRSERLISYIRPHPRPRSETLCSSLLAKTTPVLGPRQPQLDPAPRAAPTHPTRQATPPGSRQGAAGAGVLGRGASRPTGAVEDGARGMALVRFRRPYLRLGSMTASTCRRCIRAVRGRRLGMCMRILLRV